MPMTKTPHKRKSSDETEDPREFDIVVPEALRDFFLGVQTMGQGGFQSLGRMLAERLRTSAVLHLDRAEFERIARYANNYGEGGFQVKLRHLIAIWAEQNVNRL